MTLPSLGVVVVTFNSADVILDCLESLLGSQAVALTIVVVDNASSDSTATLLRDWAGGGVCEISADLPLVLRPVPKPLRLDGGENAGTAHRVQLIETGINGGFAAGVNRGLAALAAVPGLERFWIINPDSVAAPQTAAAFVDLTAPEAGFALIGGRVLYLDNPEIIQIDGGTLNRKTGVTGNLGLYARAADTPAALPSQMDFITGASMVVSRQFYETAGPMPEDYFLYYEEVDWALQRGDLPLLYCPKGIVYHRAGTAIGSPAMGRPASPFSLYFKHRARLRFMRRYFPRSLPLAYAYSLAKAAQLLVKGYPTEAWTIFSASLDLPPSAAIRARLSAEAGLRAFARSR